MFLECARSYVVHAAACVLVWCASVPVGALAYSSFRGSEYDDAIVSCCYAGVVGSVAVILPGIGVYATLIILLFRVGRFVGLVLVFLGVCVAGWGIGAALLGYAEAQYFIAAQVVGLVAFGSLAGVCMAVGYLLAMCFDITHDAMFG